MFRQDLSMMRCESSIFFSYLFNLALAFSMEKSERLITPSRTLETGLGPERYLPSILGSKPMEQRLVNYFTLALSPIIYLQRLNKSLRKYLGTIYFHLMSQCQLETMISDKKQVWCFIFGVNDYIHRLAIIVIISFMESTHFDSHQDISKEKIQSLYEHSHLLSQQSQQQHHAILSQNEPSLDLPHDFPENDPTTNKEEKQEDEVEILDPSDSQDSEEMQLPPEPIQDEDNQSGSNSQLQFSDEEIGSDQEKNQRDQTDLEQQENVTYAMQQEDVILDQQQEQRQKQAKAKSSGKQYKISLRPFQVTLIENSRDRNSIIYLPTGTGKTRISICSMYYYLCKYGTSKKIVFLANTIQLVKQQAEAIKITLQSIIRNEAFARDLRQRLGSQYIQLNWKVQDLNSQVICIHGERNEDQTITKRKRIQSLMTNRKTFLQQIKKSTITVMISQMFLNCLRRGYIKITDYSFIVFDQCHHCRGDHPYSGIMKEFYFEQKKKNKRLQDQNKLEDRDKLPIIMGLTASPVSQPFKDYKELTKQLRSLCANMDSNFAVYPFGDMVTNQTAIDIQPICEGQERELLPQLMEFFELHKDHSTSYKKIKTHFPNYFKCVHEVISLMANKHECLKVEFDGSRITDPELYLFYDIKECLLLKLRDLWLQLGQFAFMLGFHEMITELRRLSGLRNNQNTTLLQEVLQLLSKHYYSLAQEYGRCELKFMSSKVIKLINILKPHPDDLKQQKVSDMVLVFAFKRRTVKFLQLVLEKYRNQLPQQEKNFYKSIGVTGYASRQKVYRQQDGHSYQSNPSQIETQATIKKFYDDFAESQRQMRSNRVHLEQSLLGDGADNKNLTNQMARLYFSKMGKVLLQVQQKYSNQIKKIIQFKKKQHRVLITTSVTEEGFDIPGCNLVISFDTPFSLKSYIQIKGRARKKNSRYVIFTIQKDHARMQEYKKIYDNTINAIYELAINQIAKENINGMQFIEYSPSYKRVATKGGALLNTNYALQLLKGYFTSLKPPNRPYFHFIQTSNICFKCIIKFPQSATSNTPYIVGNPFSTKLEALRSAAFEAVVILKKEGLIKDDLRPSRLQELEDQLELERYDDLGLYHKDAAYRQIFDRYVQIEQCEDPSSKKKIVRFYFKSLQPQKLQFPQLNREFNTKKFEAGQPHAFQIYQIKFGNSSGNLLLSEDEQVNEIGILTCFSKEQTDSLFAGFKQRLQATSPEVFELKLISNSQMLTRIQYNYLKGIHNFLLSSQKNNEIDYYNYLNNQIPVLNPNWNYQTDKKVKLKIDPNRSYFPLLVLLRRGKNRQFQLDAGANKHIEKHIQLFKKIYSFHNKPARHVYEKPFEENLKNEMQVMEDKLKGLSDRLKLQEEDRPRLAGDKQRAKKYLLQSLSKDFCFHKGFLTMMGKYDKNVEAEQQKRKRGKLRLKFQKSRKLFQHFQPDIFQEHVIKLELWKQAAKDDISNLLSKDLKVRVVDENKGLYRLLKQFVLFPVTYPTMLRISLALKYVFQVFQDFSIALYFRKFYLKEIFESLKDRQTKQVYQFNYYRNIVIDNFEKVLRYIEEAGRSRYLRQLGKLGLSTLRRHINVIDPSINLSFNESLIAKNDLSTSQQILNQSSLGQSLFDNSMSFPEPRAVQKQALMKKEKKKGETQVDLNILENLCVQDILRSLTSKIYKHNKSQNYEQFEFIGDVVLKYLATIQIFLERTTAQEGEMHIGRANLICNANLHRAAIKKRLFLYAFTTKKKSEPAPIIRQQRQVQNKQERKHFGNTDIFVLGENDDDEGYQYIPGKVHADMMEAIIGIFYLKNKRLNDCQTLLYAFGILRRPTLKIQLHNNDPFNYDLPQCYIQLEEKLQYSFRHKGLLIQALTHPTFLEYIEDSLDENHSFSRLISEIKQNEAKAISMLGSEASLDNIIKVKKQETFYERLQFLGDAFLDLLVVEYLYDQGGEYINDEGTLSFLKQSAVSNKTLGFIALRLGLHDLILMNINDIDATLKQFRYLNKTLKGMPSPAQFSKLKIGSLKVLGDVFESLIGSILIDNEFNYEQTKEVVMRVMAPYIRHFTDLSFVEQSPNYKYKEYLDQNNYKKLKLIKVSEEGIVNGEYLYRFSDKSGNVIRQLRASNDKDAWDKFFDTKVEQSE